MKTKLEMAHEWYLKHLEAHESASVHGAWQYADAMQAEAEKRKPKEPRETHKNLAEFSMYPEYDASINYPPDAWVMYKGEKRLAVSIDIKKEWQPDWSQAPDDCRFFCVASDGGYGFFTNLEPEFMGDYFYIGCEGLMTENHGYTGDWRNSLRKRPK